MDSSKKSLKDPMTFGLASSKPDSTSKAVSSHPLEMSERNFEMQKANAEMEHLRMVQVRDQTKGTV